MFCRHYFVADRLEDLLSTRVTLDLLHEFHNCMWQSRHPWSRCLSPRDCVTDVHQRFAPFWLDLHLRLRLLSLSFSKRSTNKLVFSQSTEKRVSISWALERDVCSVTTSRPVLWIGLGFGWVRWLYSACRATSGRNSFIQSFFKEIFGGRSRWFKNFFVYDFFSFHPNSFRATIGWKCSLKDNCIRSSLKEC